MPRNRLDEEQQIEQALTESPAPPHYSEIMERIIKKRLRTTPASTVPAFITSSMKRDRHNYLTFVRKVFTH